ncbi:MAG: hypothetical protein E7258_04735 [Lachnospiraceae bacterium]|nr:hypothetical protein [Lachnospiraceae bacterium]
MDGLKEACIKCKETMDIYTKFKEEKSIIRKKCDDKIKLEMNEFKAELDEIAECADILLDNFSHYGASIRFPVTVSGEDDAVVICFNQENYSVTKLDTNEVLYKSDEDITNFPISAYEYLIVNRYTIINKTMDIIISFLNSETDEMNKKMSKETEYYDRLCERLFNEE